MEKADIEKMELLLIEGIMKRDLEFLDRTIHDDLICIVPGGQTVTKQMDLAAHKAGEMVVEKLIPEPGDISIIGDTAVSTITYDTRGSMMNIPIEGKFRYLRVWKQFDDGLKVIVASCMKI